MERLGDIPIAARCGAGKLSGDGGAEYPCVRRFRHRRLIAFLWLQGFQATANSMLIESGAIMSVRRLEQLVHRGQWRDALRFLSGFLPPPDSELRRPPLSVEAEVLHRFLAVHMTLADIAAGTDKSTAIYCQYLMSNDDRTTVCRGAIRLRSIILSIFYARQQDRASIDWECVRYKAVGIVHDLLPRTPELKDLVFMPARLVKPHHVLPIGFGFRRRRSRSRNRTRRPYALAKVYLKEQRSLPTISDPTQESRDELSVSKALDWVADIVDECLKAGKRPESHHVHPLQTGGTEGATAAPNLQAIFSSLTCPAINHGMPSVAATGGGIAAPVSQTTLGSMAHPAINPGMLSVANAGKLGSHVQTPGAPFLGIMCPPVSQTMLSNLTSRYGNSSVGLMENAGALVAPILKNMFGTLKGPAETAGMSLVNAGQSTGPALTPGAPYLVTMNAPVSQTAVGCLTSTAKNSGISLMTNNSGAPVAPAVQITNLASHAENSGAPVAPAVQTTNLASHAENSGINKCLDKEGSDAESGQKILDPSKNPRKEISILDEQDLHGKKQWPTGASGESSLTPAIET